MRVVLFVLFMSQLICRYNFEQVKSRPFVIWFFKSLLRRMEYNGVVEGESNCFETLLKPRVSSRRSLLARVCRQPAGIMENPQAICIDTFAVWNKRRRRQLPFHDFLTSWSGFIGIRFKVDSIILSLWSAGVFEFITLYSFQNYKYWLKSIYTIYSPWCVIDWSSLINWGRGQEPSPYQLFFLKPASCGLNENKVVCKEIGFRVAI